ncbi:MAG: hypothetical protein FJ291_06475 [Planctomycetes bacterium]|nr:hypothetical protein [Planctomycetota bacterium]
MRLCPLGLGGLCGAGLTFARLAPVILWTVRLRIEQFTDVLGRVDPATGRVVVLTRLNTRPPLEMKSGG